MKNQRTLAAAILSSAVLISFGLVVRADAQPEASPEPITAIATVDTVGLLEEILANDEQLVTERNELRGAITDNVENVRAELERIQNDARQRIATDPELPILQQRFQETQQQFQIVQQESAARVERLTSRQARQAYARIFDATNAVASERNLKYVMASRPGTSEIPGDRASPQAVFQDMLARNLIVSPESNDITALVREELGLPQPGVDAADVEGDAGGEG
ncbi:MAG: hypothetical protein AAGI17_08360 [Planctomycetota bacterium]